MWIEKNESVVPQSCEQQKFDTLVLRFHTIPSPILYRIGSADYLCPQKESREESNERWKNITGIQPESGFKGITVVLPAKNEATRVGLSFLLVMLNKFPTYFPVNIVMISNGSEDNTPEVINKLIHHVGKTKEIEVCRDFTEQGYGAVRIKHGNINIYHIDIKGESTKQLAINTGCKIAREADQRLLVITDTDSFVDDLPVIVRDGYQQIIEKPDTNGIITADPVACYKHVESGLKRYVLEKLSPFLANKNQDRVTGALYCVDVKLFDQMPEGKFPEIGSDDVFASAFAIYKNRKIFKSESKIFFYGPTSIKERIEQLSRNIRTAMQFRDWAETNNLPELAENIKNSSYFINPLSSRIKTLTKQIQAEPTRAMFAIVKFMLYEIARIPAIREYKQNPHLKGWTDIESTKY